MADRTVRTILDVDYEGGSAVRQATTDLREVDDAAREAGDGLKESSSGFNMLQAAAVGAVAGLVASKVNFQSVKDVARDAYEVLKEGADLSRQRSEFEGLAASIGTTADALEQDLIRAAGGLQTTADTIAGAGQLMSLGLAKTHDEAVALSEVSGRLGWDMQILGLTIANQSTARLDSLGLSIENVKSKMAELQDTGMSTEQAFKWAIIEEGRKKIEVVGDVSDTAAGKVQILEVAAREAQEQFALGFAESFADALGLIADNAAIAAPALGALSMGVGGTLGDFLGGGLDALLKLNPQFALLIARELEQQQAAAELNKVLNERQYNLEYIYQGQAELNELTAKGVEVDREFIAMQLRSSEALRERAQAAMDAKGVQEEPVSEAYWMYENIQRDTAAWEDLIARQEVAREVADLYAQQIAELTALGGDYFTTFSQNGEVTFDFSEQLYATADAAGAPLGVLRELAIEYGLMDEATADAATAAAQTQTIMDTIASAVRDGVVAWDEYAAAVEAAQAVISGQMSIPELTDLGDYGYSSYTAAQEAEREGFEIRIGADITAVETAVANAEGIVNGFVSPESVYEAVMDMDISAVETKATQATNLINEIPNEKTVTVNFEATGTWVLDELRAIGALP